MNLESSSKSETNYFPHVRVVTINWNAYEDTANLLRALQQQNYPDFSIAVVDNASSDGSADRLAKEFPSITIHRNETNLGFGGGNNIVLKQALENDIPFVWLINNDAVPERDTLSVMINAIESKSDIAACGAVLLESNSDKITETWGGGSIVYPLAWVRPYRQHVESASYISGACMLLRTEALIQTGLFDERYFLYWEDTDLCFRLRENGWKFAVAHTRVQHATSSSTGRDPMARSRHTMRSYVLFLHRHECCATLNSITATLFQSTLKLVRGKWRAAAGFWLGLRDGHKYLRLTDSHAA